MSTVFFPDSECQVTVVDPGKVSRKVKARGGDMMIVEVSFATGGVGPSHKHPHEQATYCASGEFMFTVEGETKRLLAGDTVYIPSGADHSTVCVLAGKLVDVFSPQRQDFLA
ncbi:MAG: cupin domain-containing protein [Rectinemataceae bacterium]|nr:cupin domain-containing protein [Rectinemataceae bacterium]